MTNFHVCEAVESKLENYTWASKQAGLLIVCVQSKGNVTALGTLL